MNINKGQVKTIGKIGLNLGKKILLKGTQALILEGLVTTVNTGFENGIDGVKKLKLKDFVGEYETETEEIEVVETEIIED